MDPLQYQLKSIRLSGMASMLPVRLQEATARELSYLEFLSLLVEDELSRRRDRLLERRLKAARLPEMKTLDGFQFDFNPSINRKQIRELTAARFVFERENVLLVGPPGVGKTHLAIAIGVSAIEKGYSVLYRSVFDLVEDLFEAQALGTRRELIAALVKPDLLILDEFGMKKLPPTAAEDLLEVFHRRSRHGANIVATNRPIEDFGKIMGDNAAATAILDRLLERAHLIPITGRSYRLRRATSLMKELPSDPEPLAEPNQET